MREEVHRPDRARAVLAALTTMLILPALGCGGGGRAAVPTRPLDPHSRPIGVGPEYHPPPGANARTGWQCRRGRGTRYGVHLELFARRFVVIVPAGIGVAPPRVRNGAYVVGGRCSYPARTIEPTGVIQVERGTRLTLGDFFRIWGLPFRGTRLLSFRGRVHAFVGGRAWRRDIGAIPLTRHAEIQVEILGHVPTRVGYRFRPGL